MFKNLWRDLSAQYKRDPAARNRFHVLCFSPGFHAIANYRLAHLFWRLGWQWGALGVSYVSRCWTNIEIHPGSTIGPGFCIDHGAGVVIGETAVVGQNVTLYHGVTLGAIKFESGKRHPTVGDNVILGCRATVLGDIAVGEGARIGAGALIISEVQPDTTWVAAPADQLGAQGNVVKLPVGADQKEWLNFGAGI